MWAAACGSTLLVTALWACRGHDGGRRPAGDVADEVRDTPAALVVGERAYGARCATCHGPRGTGSEQGPPLVHPIYEPGHHADAAFHLAVTRGVRAHHWTFGDMPPVPDVSRSEVAAIVSYVRWLQRQAGIH